MADTVDSNVIATTSSTTDTTASTTSPANTPIDQSVLDSWVNLDTDIQNVNTDLTNHNNLIDTTHSKLTSFTTDITNLGAGLQNIDKLTTDQTAKFGLLTTAAIGVGSSFKGLSHIDSGGLVTFSSQFEKMQELLSQPGTGFGVVTDAIKKMSLTLVGMGRPQSEVAAAVASGASGFFTYAKNVAESADSQSRLQESMIQSAAAAGNLDYVYKGAGTEFQNMNAILEKQSTLFYDVMKATGEIDANKIAAYAKELQAIPGGLKAMDSDTILLGKSTNILADAITYARGSGRAYKEVTNDMNQAVLEYGVSLSEALQFTSRITDISNKYGATIDDVRQSLLKSADAFKMFTAGGDGAFNMTQNISETMAEYIAQLKAVGVPAQNAIGMFNEMATAISGMGIANKGFLSGQSGGPGGLLGALQIDKQLKAGDLKGVFDKVQAEMKRLTGPVITLDQVNTQQDASKYERQRMMLQQGPLGSIVKDDREADRVIEAMAKGSVPTQLLDSQQALKGTIDKGTDIQQLSYTELSKIAINTSGLQMGAGVANLTTLQNMLTARSGASQPTGNVSEAAKEQTRNFQRGGQTGDRGQASVIALRDLSNEIKTLPSAVARTADSFKQALTTGNKDLAEKSAVELKAIFESEKQKVQSLPDSQKSAILNRINAAEKSIDMMGVGSQVGAVVNNSARQNQNRNQTQNQGQGVQQNNGMPIPVVLSGNSQIAVNVTSTCAHCGNKTETSQHASIINPAAGK
jgi:hypothetical protein